MKKSIIFAVLCIVSFVSVSAHAVCTRSDAHIVRVTAYNDGVGTYHYIYLRDSALSSNYYYARTSDDEMAAIATTALANTTTVTVQGAASSCPTTGTGRNMGDLRYIVVNP